MNQNTTEDAGRQEHAACEPATTSSVGPAPSSNGQPANPTGPTPEPNPSKQAQLEAFFRFISVPGACAEVRVIDAMSWRIKDTKKIIKGTGIISGWFGPDDITYVLSEVGRLKDVSAYLTCNPVRDYMLGKSFRKLDKAESNTTDADIVAVRILYIDIDPPKPTSGVSATAEERDAALELRNMILNDFPELAASAIWGSSGNGGFIAVQVIPHQGNALVKRAVTYLADQYKDHTAKIDTVATNPSRVMCLPGTLKCKGSNLPKIRPWRYATLESPIAKDDGKWLALTKNPEPLDLQAWLDRVCPVEAMQEPESGGGPGVGGNAERPTGREGGQGAGSGVNHRAYLDAVIRGETAEIKIAVPGDRNTRFNKAVYAIGQRAHLFAASDLDEESVKADLARVAAEIGLEPGEIAKTLRSGWEKGKAKPRDPKSDAPQPSNATEAKPSNATEAKGTKLQKPGSNGCPADYSALSNDDLGILPADTLEPEPIDWLWQDRVARGKLALLAGKGADGKTQIALRFAAAVSTGGLLPDGSGNAVRGEVLILSAEDGRKDTLIPRLMALGADLSRIKFVTAKVSYKDKDGNVLIDPKSFSDLEYWKELIKRIPNTLLIIADTLPSYLGRGVNDSRNQDVRTALEPFIDILDRQRIAMLGICHLGKNPDHKTPSDKILGSVAYANLARTVHVTMPHPTEEDKKILCEIKNNNGPEQGTLSYKIEEKMIEHNSISIRTSLVVFDEGTIDITAQEAMDATKPGKKRGPKTKRLQEIAEWLYDYLKEGGKVPVRDILNAAGEKGYVGEIDEESNKWTNANNLYRAKDILPKLEVPRDGWRVDDITAPRGRDGRDTLHWYLAREDSAY